jgi:hypothetical protein
MKKFYFGHSALFCAFALIGVTLSARPAVGQSDTPAATPVSAPANTGRIPVTSTASPEIRELQKVEDNWSGALNQRDQYALELVLSPLFVDVSATGEVSTRDQEIANLINPGENKDPATTSQHVITVRMLGDVAVANGTYSFTHKVNSSIVVEKGVFTHVFQRLHGNWLCVNSQRTALREEAPAAKAKTKTKSGAELPFHIPLFSKSDKSTTTEK